MGETIGKMWLQVGEKLLPARNVCKASLEISFRTSSKNTIR